jgi:hypothetical protein
LAGVLIGLSIVTPVLAETGTPPPILHTLAMLGSIVLFSFGLLLKAMSTAQPPRKLGPEVWRVGRGGLRTRTAVM